jgi:two-component system CheB/CheR fusion protein
MSNAADDASFERILEYLRQSRGFDFLAYKRSSLQRRLLKRMQTIGVQTFDSYLDYLQVHTEEFGSLFNTILINVTSFFRDQDVWDALRTEIVPQLIAGRPASDPVRVWSAGCSAGQEAYSTAMLFAEHLGLDQFRDRVKLYGTDIDEEALKEARQAVYTAKQIEDVPEALREKYFEPNGELFTFNREVRRAVIFGRHDLLQDAPISRIDLLLCRNTLMYFNAEGQARITQRFSYSLNPNGVLVLGRAEMLFSQDDLFQPIDLKRRLFVPLPRSQYRGRLLAGPQSREEPVGSHANRLRLRDAAFDSTADAQLVFDGGGLLAAANAAARRQFALTDGDIGAALQDLQLSYRPTELRPSLDRAREERRDVALRGVSSEHAGVVQFFDIILSPLLDADRSVMGTRVTFTDVTPLKSLQEELTHSKQELETAYEELQSTNEELETTNEELQSTVEELETTNEELQSTNEELETMNEELQSSNEELQTMNDELRHRTSELNMSNAFLESVFTSLRSPVVVVDRDVRVDVWNAAATNLWGVRADEARGVNFFNLDIGLPVGELHQPLKDVIHGGSERREVTLGATSRKGKLLQCRVSVSPLTGPSRDVRGAVLVMEEVEKV